MAENPVAISLFFRGKICAQKLDQYQNYQIHKSYKAQQNCTAINITHAMFVNIWLNKVKIIHENYIRVGLGDPKQICLLYPV